MKILSTILLALTFLTSGTAQTPDKAKLEQFFDRLAEKNKAMGSLVVSRDGQVIYSRAIGYSQINGSDGKPATTATRYRIGSITKMFTATLVFQLVEEKKLKLTDTLDKFLPQIPNAKKITVAQILAHRSGIHDFVRDPEFRSWKTKSRTKDEVIAFIAKGAPDFEPDAKFSYSNSGYILLGYIVEKLTGKPYREVLKDRITSKIGLKDTYLGIGNTDAVKGESFSYKYVGDWKQEPETDLSIPGGAGAIISTPTDLTKFIRSLFELKLISQDSLNQMKTMKDGYGMGMETIPLDGKIGYGHTGAIDDFHSILVYLPEEKLAIAYTTNGMVYPATDIVGNVFDIYSNKPFAIPAFETINVSPEVLDKYVGVYTSSQVPLKLTISRNGTTLFVQPTGQSVFPLEATAPDKFKVESRGITLEFDAAKNQMTFKRGGSAQELVFTKGN